MKPQSVGGRLLPAVIDQIAESEPVAVYAEYATLSIDGQIRLNPVTYRQFANSINGVAWWLQKELGRGDSHRTLAYIGPNDLRYYILIVAAVKAGYKMLFTSPRNSLPAHMNLLDALDCHTMITTSPQPTSVAGIITAHTMQVLSIPELAELLVGNYSHYPYEKTFEKAHSDPVVCLHTSGSTGLPKPIIINHAFCTAIEKVCKSPAPKGYESAHEKYLGTRMFTALPLFHSFIECRTILSVLEGERSKHSFRKSVILAKTTSGFTSLFSKKESSVNRLKAAGVYVSLITAVFTRTIMIMLPPDLVSADRVIEVLDCAKADVALLPPSILEDISKQPHLLEKLKNLQHVIYSGGALPKTAGDAVASKVQLWTVLGATEISCLSQLMVEPEDWEYIHPSPTSGAEFRYSADGLYELVVVRKTEEDCLPCFELFPELQEYHTHDLYLPHPTKSGLWSHQGRTDDIIVFLNGEKTNPVTMEQQLQAQPIIRSALVVGQGRFEAALLIELNTGSKFSTEQNFELTQGSQISAKQKAEIIEHIWPSVERANSECPAHARISKSHILFVNPDKSMVRAGKSTVQRKATLALYSQEIEALYADVHTASFTNLSDFHLKIQLEDIETMKISLRQIICLVTLWEELTDNEDLFARGLDSLQVIQIVRYLKAGLVPNGTWIEEIAPSTVYTSASVSKLAAALVSLRLQDERSKEAKEQARGTMMTTMLNGSIASLQAVELYTQFSTATPSEIILTGSTGALGSYLLEALYTSPAKLRINCLNRSDDSQRRQSRTNKSRGLTTNFDPNYVKFFSVDFSRDHLGLDPSTYEKLLRTTSLIIHNAWQVDFNLALSAFEKTHIKGVCNLIKFSLRSQAKIFFISTIGTVTNWPLRHSTSVVPEEVITDFTVPAQMGYAESKYVLERLLSHTADTFNISVSICRVGQIAGPAGSSQGTWNKAEWLPSLIISSRYLGILPDSLGAMENIDWIPIDLLSIIIAELAIGKGTAAATRTAATQKTTSNAIVYHAVNPRTTTWATLLPTIKITLSTSTQEIEIVPLETWITALRSSAGPEPTKEFLERNPALKLLEFYESLMPNRTELPHVRLETEKTVAACSSMGKMEAVKPEWMREWVRQWLD